jgi:hypothetical protein
MSNLSKSNKNKTKGASRPRNKRTTKRRPQGRPKRTRGQQPRGRAAGRSGSSPANGARIGHKIGHFLGGVAKGALRSVFGMGEYKTALSAETGEEDVVESDQPAVNSLVTPVSTNTVPMMHTDKEGTVRICRREFMEVVLIKDAPLVLTYKVQPGNSKIFPWMSNIAHNWQQYQFLGLAIEFVPTSGSAVGSSAQGPALGQVATCFKYNVTEQNIDGWPANSLQGMLNMQGSVSCSPAACSTCYMECDPALSNQPVRFIENEQPIIATGLSQQNYQAAQLLVYASGAVSGNAFQAGQLWVTYDIMLFNPRPVEPDVITPWFERKEFEEYFVLAHDLDVLESCPGPFSEEELIARIAIMRDIRAKLNTPAVYLASDLARALASRELVQFESAKLDGACRKIIHESAIFKLMKKLDAQDNFDVVSNYGDVDTPRCY